MLIGYARVSTTDQHLEAQLDTLKAAGCERIFSEAYTGKVADERRELQACLAQLEPGDVLVVTKLDRCARSLFDLMAMLNDLMARGVGFRCLTQPVDLTTPLGKFTAQILGAVAEFELSLIAERRREGIARAKAEGKYRGRKPAHPPERILAALSEGHRGQALAEALGCHMATAYRYQAKHGVA